MVSGEARDPRRDAAFALFIALGTVIVIYTFAQWIVVALLPGAAHSARPLADAARVMLGNGGAALISIGALVSVFGYMASTMLTGPRALFALAEQGDFPEFFATVHRRFRTPWFSILVFAVSLWGLALAGSFAWNVTVSAVGRFFYYGLTCAAVPVLRRKQKGNALFRLPGGLFLPGLGVLICVTLLTRADFSQSLILSGTCAVALCNWVLVRQRPTPLIAAPDVAQDSGRD